MARRAPRHGARRVAHRGEEGQRTPSVSPEEAVLDALCFGWIDSKRESLDADRYRQAYTPRKPKSTWSRINKERVERLIRDG